MEKKELTNWQVTRIGGGCGLVITLFWFAWLLADYISSSYWNSYLIGFTLISLPAIPGGVIGAFIGRKWKKSRTATWIGAILGAILGVYIGLSLSGMDLA